jgi:hypothetical protein
MRCEQSVWAMRDQDSQSRAIHHRGDFVSIILDEGVSVNMLTEYYTRPVLQSARPLSEVTAGTLQWCAIRRLS